MFSDSLHRRYPKSSIKAGWIFVSVASYRDSRCTDTIADMFAKARNPHRLTVGLCQQNAPGDPDTITDTVLEGYSRNIKVIRMGHDEARGPTWARWKCSHLWDGEEYFLQIDAHTKFKKNWDSDTKDMFGMLGMHRAVITHYPPSDTGSIENIQGKTVITPTAEVNSKNELIATGKEVPATSFPTEGKFVGACFLFARYNFLLEIPFDPYLPYLFQGEEPLLAMRLFTRGWKIYHPTHSVCMHYYVRSSDPKFWDDHQAQFDRWNPVARHRAEFLMGLRKPERGVMALVYRNADVYGAGSVRSLAEWHAQLGVDWKRHFVN